jgi:hypothetical protein
MLLENEGLYPPFVTHIWRPVMADERYPPLGTNRTIFVCDTQNIFTSQRAADELHLWHHRLIAHCNKCDREQGSAKRNNNRMAPTVSWNWYIFYIDDPKQILHCRLTFDSVCCLRVRKLTEKLVYQVRSTGLHGSEKLRDVYPVWLDLQLAGKPVNLCQYTEWIELIDPCFLTTDSQELHAAVVDKVYQAYWGRPGEWSII